MARIVWTAHFRRRQRQRQITDDEVVLAWTQPDVDRPSPDHPGASERTAILPDGQRITVVARQTKDALELITCWRD